MDTNQAALQRIAKASKALMWHPETVAYACINAHYPIEITTRVPTAATNGKQRLYNPNYVMSLTDAELMFLICHESDHDGKKHVFRLGNRNLALANVAADYQVNQDLSRIPFLKMPQGGLIDKRFDGMSFEAIYRTLDAEQKQKQDQQKQDNQDSDDSDDSQDNQENDESESDDSQDSDNDSSDSDEKRDNDTQSNDSQEGNQDTDSDENASGDDASDDDRESDNGPDQSDDSSDNASDESGDDETSGDNGDESGKEDDADSSDTIDDGNNDNGKDSRKAQAGSGDESQDKPELIDACDPGMCGGFMRPDNAGDAAEMAELENEADIMIAQAMQAATKMNGGILPGNLQGMMIDKRQSKQDWKAELREFFTTSTKTDFSWSRPDRRFSLADFILPSEISDGINHFGMAIDFSYSIQKEWLDTFVGEAQAMLDLGVIDKLTVVLFHTSVFQSFEFNSGDIIEIDTAERGGTCFVPVFDWFRDNAPDIAGLCMLTDLEPSESWVTLESKQLDCPTLFAVYGNPIVSREYIKQATFGRCLPLWDE